MRRFSFFSGTNQSGELFSTLGDLVGTDYRASEVIEDYEKAFGTAVGAPHAVSFGAGRMALYAILDALNIGEGDEVILPAYTCVVVPNALIYRGAKPIYVDIEPTTFNIDASLVSRAITPRTKALYLQNTFGVIADVDRIREIGKRNGLPVIEDAAHSLGATFGGKKSGALSDVAFFTTDHSKVINTHLGGMVTTQDSEIGRKVRGLQERTPFLDSFKVRRILCTHVIEHVCFAPTFLWLGRPLHSTLNRLGLCFYFRDEMMTSRPTTYPYPCRLSAPQARLGLSQIANLEKNLVHRRAIAGWLESRLGWYVGRPTGWVNDQTWLRYSFLVRDRNEFVRRFRKHFDLGIWFTSVTHGRNQDFGAIGYAVGSCPVAEKVAHHIVNIPTHPRVSQSVLKTAWLENEAWIQANTIRI